MNSFCFLIFKKSFHIPSYSICFNEHLYPATFQISIFNPDLILEPQIFYSFAYFTSPLECSSLTCFKLSSLYWLPTSSLPHSSCSLLHGNGKLGCSRQNPGRYPWLVFFNPPTFNQPPFYQLNFINSSWNHPSPPKHIISVQHTTNSHFDSAFMFTLIPHSLSLLLVFSFSNPFCTLQQNWYCQTGILW